MKQQSVGIKVVLMRFYVAGFALSKAKLPVLVLSQTCDVREYWILATEIAEENSKRPSLQLYMELLSTINPILNYCEAA